MKYKLHIIIIILSVLQFNVKAAQNYAFFSGESQNIEIQLTKSKGMPFVWNLKFKHRTITEGDGIVDISGNASIDISIPAAKPGIVIETTLTIMTKSEKLSIPAKIYSSNPFGGREPDMKTLYLLDNSDNGSVEKFLKIHKIKYIRINNIKAFNVKKGLLIVAGLRMESHPGVPESLIKATEPDNRIICFLPAGSELKFNASHIKSISSIEAGTNTRERLQYTRDAFVTISNKATGGGCNELDIPVGKGNIYIYPHTSISEMKKSPVMLYSFAEKFFNKKMKGKLK